MLNHSRFQLIPWVETIHGKDEIVALKVNILGFSFVLLLEPFDPERFPELVTANYRPGRIEIQYAKSISWITISWEDSHPHSQLSVQHVKAVDAPKAPAQGS